MDDKEKVIETFRNSEDPLNAKKVSELSGVEKKEVDKIMKELKKDETIVSPKRCYWTLVEKLYLFLLFHQIYFLVSLLTVSLETFILFQKYN